MTFERPELLALAPLLALVLALGVAAQWRRGLRLMDAFGGRAPSMRLASRDLRRFPTSRLISLVVVSIALTVAAAGPDGAVAPTQDERVPIDLVIALDISRSMAAEDVGVSRLRRATEVVARLTETLPGERVGVTVFAGWPYTLVPLTDDPNVIRFFMESLSPDLLLERDQGTSLGAAVMRARSTLEARRRPDAEPVILLLTDGDAFDDEASILDSVSVAASEGVRLWTAGVGTAAGAPLSEPGSRNPLLNEDGAPVVVRLNEPLLRRIAEAGGGSYHDVSDERGLGALLDDLTGVARNTGSKDKELRWAFWLTLFGLPLLLWEGAADSGRPRPRGQGEEDT